MVQWVDRAQRLDGSWSKRFCDSVILNLSGEAGAQRGREEGGVDERRLEEGEDGEEGSGEGSRDAGGGYGLNTKHLERREVTLFHYARSQI